MLRPMATYVFPPWPPQQTDAQREHLRHTICNWALTNGLAVRPSERLVDTDGHVPETLATHAPVTFFPSPIPRSCYEDGLALQTAYNELYAGITGDEQWLASVLTGILEVDEYIDKLWSVHLAVKKEGYVQELCLGLFRSDYMVHLDSAVEDAKPELKQVEFNTMASSMAGLASKASSLHRYLQRTSAYQTHPEVASAALPPNEASSLLAAGLIEAHDAYGESKCSPPLPTCVVFIVQEREGNIFDQKHVEYQLEERHIPVFRLPFSRVLEHTEVSEDSFRRLTYRPPHSPNTPYEVSLVYFRAGYSPAEYASTTAWQARVHIERSAAIKCPTVLTHLAGSKKVQQVLATPSSPHVDHFLPAQAFMAERVRGTFANIYPLDESAAGQEARKLALNPETAVRYVLKPQREGGGNNHYRGAIPGFLRSIPESHWKGYILMEIIDPPALANSALRNGQTTTGQVIGEYGVYGACLWRQTYARAVSSDDNDVESRTESQPRALAGPSLADLPPTGNSNESKIEILYNTQAGYVLRTKARMSEEGGIAAGYGYVDSCFPVDPYKEPSADDKE